jgi:hypothetical protein
VALFLGAKLDGGGNLHPVATLEQAAATAVALARGEAADARRGAVATDAQPPQLASSQRNLRGLYSGGTYCTEAQLVWRDAGLETWSNAPLEKRLALSHGAASRSHTAIDLGADEFTVGRPHPMIDFAARLERLAAEARDPSVAAIVLDVVLGYGAHPDPAAALAPAVRTARAEAARGGRDLAVIGFVCGTEDDPQRLPSQVAALAASGMILAPGSTEAAAAAARVVAGR